MPSSNVMKRAIVPVSATSPARLKAVVKAKAKLKPRPKSVVKAKAKAKASVQVFTAIGGAIFSRQKETTDVELELLVPIPGVVMPGNVSDEVHAFLKRVKVSRDLSPKAKDPFIEALEKNVRDKHIRIPFKWSVSSRAFERFLFEAEYNNSVSCWSAKISIVEEQSVVVVCKIDKNVDKQAQPTNPKGFVSFPNDYQDEQVNARRNDVHTRRKIMMLWVMLEFCHFTKKAQEKNNARLSFLPFFTRFLWTTREAPQARFSQARLSRLSQANSARATLPSSRPSLRPSSHSESHPQSQGPKYLQSVRLSLAKMPPPSSASASASASVYASASTTASMRPRPSQARPSAGQPRRPSTNSLVAW